MKKKVCTTTKQDINVKRSESNVYDRICCEKHYGKSAQEKLLCSKTHSIATNFCITGKKKGQSLLFFGFNKGRKCFICPVQRFRACSMDISNNFLKITNIERKNCEVK